jgi:predicted GTPase
MKAVTNMNNNSQDDNQDMIKEMLNLFRKVFARKNNTSMEEQNTDSFDVFTEFKRQIEEDSKTKIRVAFFGQPGAGKSSLMNKLSGKKLADAGIEPGMKVTKHVWGENDSIEFIDLPGFDGIPEEHIKQAYWENYECDNVDLFLCCFESKFNQADAEFFKRVIFEGKSSIFVRTKSDNIFDEDKTILELKEEILFKQVFPMFGELVKVVFTSVRTNEGLSDLQNQIINLLDETQKEKWFRNAQAYSKDFLEEKKKACKIILLKYSIIAAGNGAIPIPLVGAPIDIGIFIKLLNDIRISYGLSNERLNKLLNNHRTDQQLKVIVKQIVDYIGKEGALLLLKRFAGQELVKQMSKGIPIILGSATGFALTYYSGLKFLDDCHIIAKQILENEILTNKIERLTS